ncbi:MAG TPA: hypothetical protein VKR83_06970 [Ktedonobacteraceae bacterium]|nr:hypothetical protein [Ktedonobacteraceae bacterium]
MSKVKLRCTTCGKWFQSANAKEVTCPDCVQKARKEKLAARTTPPANKTPGISSPARPVPPPPKPKPAAGGTSHWFDEVSDVKVGEPEQPQRPKLPPSPAPRDTRGGQDSFGNRGPGGYRDRDDRGPGGPGNYRERGPGGYRDRDDRGPGGYRESGYRPGGPGGYRPGGPGTLDTPGYRPRQPMDGGFNRGPRTGAPDQSRPDARKGGNPPRAKSSKPPTPPKPKREKIPPPAPFVPTPEQIAQVEARYQELATPQEFDGIRTQIATELSIPKKAVKKIVKDFRDRNNIPSWWETQVYKGDSEELAKIKAAYEPYLPVPPVGVHKKIADELSLKAGIVYQAIKAIRLELNLPQFNDPTLHADELAALRRQKASTAGETSSEASITADATPSTGEVTETTGDAAAAKSEATGDAAPSTGETAATTPDAVPTEAEEKRTPVEVAVSPVDEEHNVADNS